MIDALTYIASTTQNTGYALHWLHYTATKAEDKITETQVQNHQRDAYKSYAESQLQPLTTHHQQLYQIILELTNETESIHTGAVYQQYQETVNNPLSNRRISDFLKQLELLQLIQSHYHYGGTKGKTREITPKHQ